VRARPATNVTGVDACGLTVGYRRITDCTAATFEDLQGCASSLLEEGADDRIRAAQFVVSDGTMELAMPAYNTWRVACVDHVAVVYANPYDALSRRSFVAIEIAGGRITRAHRMTIVDHEEGGSDCANAWDGVSLVPIIESSALLGAVVHGAAASPRFDTTRGDVGDATFANQDGRYDDAPLAYRATTEGLAPIDVTTSTPAAPPCPLRVVDPDGETNVRPSPSTRRAPVGTIATGTVIQPVEQRGRWYRVEQPLAGWLFAGGLSRRCAP